MHLCQYVKTSQDDIWCIIGVWPSSLEVSTGWARFRPFEAVGIYAIAQQLVAHPTQEIIRRERPLMLTLESLRHHLMG